MVFTKISEGTFSRSSLDPMDGTHTHTHTETYLVHVTLCYTLLCLIVFIADTGKECFVWVGKGASQNERRQAMSYSHVCFYPLQSIHYTVLLLLLL